MKLKVNLQVMNRPKQHFIIRQILKRNSLRSKQYLYFSRDRLPYQHDNLCSIKHKNNKKKCWRDALDSELIIN